MHSITTFNPPHFPEYFSLFIVLYCVSVFAFCVSFTVLCCCIFIVCTSSCIFLWLQDTTNDWYIKQPRHQPSGLCYLWHSPIACLPVPCVRNVSELKQHLLNDWYVYVVEHGIIDSTINEWRMNLQACLPLKQEILSKCCNNINNWLNIQHHRLCETLKC